VSMRRGFLILIFSIGGLSGCVQANSETILGSSQRVTCEIILEQLAQKQDEELYKYIYFLNYELDKSHLANDQIDLIIEKLLEIQESDPYQKEVVGKGGKVVGYFNRWATRGCIFRFRFQKIANNLRALPVEERVAGIVEGMVNPPKLGYSTPKKFAGELVIAGKEAVPFIIGHKPKEPYLRRNIVWALGQIGDSRGVPYIIEVLRVEDETFGSARVEAAKALGNFKGKKVVAALVAALRDQTYRDIDRHLPQVRRPGHVPYLGRYYSVQHAASESLSDITGHNWGLVYNEDHKTWSAWFTAKRQEGFTPARVARTAQEVEKLVELLFHRYMSARPNPWQRENILATAEGIKSISEDLKPLGKSVVSGLVKVCNEQVEKSVLWREELQRWTKSVLVSLEWDEAVQAVSRIGEEKTDERVGRKKAGNSWIEPAVRLE